MLFANAALENVSKHYHKTDEADAYINLSWHDPASESGIVMTITSLGRNVERSCGAKYRESGVATLSKIGIDLQTSV
jgi:hypothetical protein